MSLRLTISMLKMVATAMLLYVAIPSIAGSLPTLETLHTFNSAGDGWKPDPFAGSLYLASDGNYYGTTIYGGPHFGGTIYRLTPDGVYTTIHQFGLTTAFVDGTNPACSLVEDPVSHYLCGTTTNGGADGFGTVFKISPSGTNYSQIYSFKGGTADGENPTGVVADSNGTLYGMTNAGAADGLGSVFKIGADGQGFKDIYDLNAYFSGYTFNHAPILIKDTLYAITQTVTINTPSNIFSVRTDGTVPSVIQILNNSDTPGTGGLCDGGDGYFYYVATGGSGSYRGELFRVKHTGGTPTLLHGFDSATDGDSPTCTLVSDHAGGIYGTTATVGTDPENSGNGSIFKYDTITSTYSVLAHLPNTNGSAGNAGPIIGADGMLWGTISDGGVAGYGTIYKQPTTAAPTQVVYEFGNGLFDGGYPNPGLVIGSDLSIIGTSNSGGTYQSGDVYSLGPDGTYGVVTDFNASRQIMPYGPAYGLTVGPAGQLFGLSSYGGAHEDGALYSLSPELSTPTIVFSFNNTDGRIPFGKLTFGTDGNFYCVTENGGTDSDGALLRIAPDGSSYTVLHSFTGGPDGAYPTGVIQASDGNFYGTAARGAVDNDGTVFKYSATTGFSVLHTFKGTDGSLPEPVIEASDGMLYGATVDGGASSKGVLFKIGKSGGDTFHVMNAFDGATHGGNPEGALFQGSTGLLYGAASTGGPNGGGTLFQVGLEGADSLYTICALPVSGSTASDPNGPLQEAADGNLYGVTINGGIVPPGETSTYLQGSLFRLKLMAPIINGYSVASASPGQSIAISGANFAGVTSVSFNGVSATPTSFTANTVTVTVPAGATSGQVQVTEALNGKTYAVYSSTPFTVTQ